MNQYQNIGSGTWFLGDCLEVMATAPDKSVDLILCDLPYGTTQNKWDSVIPLEPLWKEYWRICKGAIVLTAAQPFTSALIMSQVERFKYSICWNKIQVTNFLNAKKQPLRQHETVCVFGKGTYNPQMGVGEPYKNKGRSNKTENYGEQQEHDDTNNGERYPTDLITFNQPRNGFHPTQKPVELFEYLVKTYSNEGDLVLDNTAGSGTTAIACENTKRRWICIENSEDYSDKAIERIKAHLV